MLESGLPGGGPLRMCRSSPACFPGVHASDSDAGTRMGDTGPGEEAAAPRDS